MTAVERALRSLLSGEGASSSRDFGRGVAYAVGVIQSAQEEDARAAADAAIRRDPRPRPPRPGDPQVPPW